MKIILLASILLLELGAIAADTSIPLQGVMTREEYDQMGLSKLTLQERQNLEAWLAKFRSKVELATQSPSGKTNIVAPSTPEEILRATLRTKDEANQRQNNVPAQRAFPEAARQVNAVADQPDVIKVDPSTKRTLVSIGTGKTTIIQLNDGRVFSAVSEYKNESRNWTVGQTVVVTNKAGLVYLLNTKTGTEEFVQEVQLSK